MVVIGIVDYFLLKWIEKSRGGKDRKSKSG